MEVFAILYLLPSCAVAIFYLTRKEQAVAARVWGLLGGFALVPLFLYIIPIPAFIMAIGGTALALKRPHLAGVLMLMGAIISGAFLILLLPLMAWDGDKLPWYFALAIFGSSLLAISFLISGGILSLTSRKGQRASKKMVVGAITVLFALFVLGSTFLLLLFPLK